MRLVSLFLQEGLSNFLCKISFSVAFGNKPNWMNQSFDKMYMAGCKCYCLVSCLWNNNGILGTAHIQKDMTVAARFRLLFFFNQS